MVYGLPVAKGHVYAAIVEVGSRPYVCCGWVWKILWNGCTIYTNVRNPQDNDTDYNMGIHNCKKGPVPDLVLVIGNFIFLNSL